MPTEPAYIRKLKAFARGDLTFSDLPQLEEEMYRAGDRATVLMSCAVLETCLTIFLGDKMRPSLSSDDNRRLFDSGGPLHDLSSKTIIGYSFNLFGPETKHDMDLIRILRNQLAHSRRSFGFSTPEVKEFCKYLKSPDWPSVLIPKAYLDTAPHDELASAIDKQNAKTRYVTACHNIAEHLLQNTQQAAIHGIAVPDLR